ncbi:MAG: DUF3857 domain-containing protein [Flavobacteriaceae bacterium]|nr:DUF3857 domain-containing protein [Flavobacteriaceae bacterium]
MKKIIISFALLMLTVTSHAQELELPFKFGNIPLNELNLKYYEKDASANAVVLYEKALAKMIYSSGNILIQTTYYHKIKIFKKDGYSNATITIPLYNNLKVHEWVVKIKALTHNLENGHDNPTYLSKKKIYKTKISDTYKEVKFTLPNVKEGSVIEYTYTIKSPYFSRFTGWEFQGNIPKIYSELHSLIPGNWVYNKKLVGFRKLDINKIKIKKKCFFIIGLEAPAECEDLTFAMKDVPAFKEEAYLTSKKNYLSRIAFELSEVFYFDGRHKKYTKTWKDVDKQFKYEYKIGSQLKKIDYTRSLLPRELLNETDKLKRAVNIYHFIQNHFSWNEEYHIFRKVNFKKAYKSKTGNATEINIALCNALNAAGIKSNLMLISTRNNGLPTFVHPVLSDFNYAIVVSHIDKKIYKLDASQKLAPFSLLPYRALNSYGRVMDFENESYWENLDANRNITTTSINLHFNEDVLEGMMRVSSTAYTALKKRDEIISKGELNYRKDFENDSEMNDLIIESYRNKNLENLEKLFIEDFKISLGNELSDDDMLIINPFFGSQTKNPFTLEDRDYPVDFGYPRTKNYRFIFDVPEGYIISSVPKNITLSLPYNAANLVSKSTINNQKITIDFKLSINKTSFPPKEYNELKDFYKNLINLYSDVIILKKK